MAEQEKPVAREGPGLSSWLDSLQQESWQLELLISGFVVFLLIGGWGPVKDLEYDLDLILNVSGKYSFLNFLYYVLRTAYLSLLACLLFHVVLRGMWIAAIGLRSISGDIEFDQLPYQPRFKERLRRRLGSFDQYIERLERNCSVIFSLAFLIFFCFLSLATWAIFVMVVQVVYLWLTGGTFQGNGIFGGAGIISITVFVLGLVYLLDFVTLGWLKRVRWLHRPYYYLYIFMGWVTLARLYRPLYYNLIDNRFGKKLAISLPVVILLILVLVSLRQVKYDYFPALVDDGKVWMDYNNYDDESPNLFDQLWRTSLASRFPENNYVRAFIPYRPRYDNEILLRIDSTLDISQYTGTKLRGAFTVGQQYNPDADYEAILATFAKFHHLSINDTLLLDVPPLFKIHPERRQPGVEYMIPVHQLPEGRHRLKVQTRIEEGDTLRWSAGYNIYFYK